MSPDQARRDDRGKPPIHLVPPQFIHHLSRIFEYGAGKYTPENWRKGMDYSRMYDSAMRHLLAFWGGEDEDKESQLPHLAHAAWNCLALLWYLDNLTLDLDDREEIEV